MMLHQVVLLLLSTSTLILAKHYQDVPCQWKSLSGANYDLRPLSLPSSKASYYIEDGDIPCTPEKEPTFSWEWNFCANVAPVPKPCSKMGKTSGVALQYLEMSDGFYDCYIIGRYDPAHDDLYFSMLDPTDPSKGVSMRYPDGEKCTLPGSAGGAGNSGTRLRSATIDVICDDVALKVESATEPETCEYHMVMRSWHGCPTTCPVTSHGLCNSHGHCAYDQKKNEAYCYCNAGWGGSDCSKRVSSSNSDSSSGSSGQSMQIGFLVVLLLITVVLVALVGLMGYKINVYRKQQEIAAYTTLSSNEMIDRNGF